VLDLKGNVVAFLKALATLGHSAYVIREIEHWEVQAERHSCYHFSLSRN
jgi:hypothetical protein